MNNKTPNMLDTAMIFGAGLGTRLAPITQTRPKALAEVAGVSLLEWNLRYLVRFGIKNVVLNVHHFADMLETEAKRLCQLYKLNLSVSNERETLLDTGGGLLHAKHLVPQKAPFLVLNVDVLTNLNLESLYQAYISRPQSLACLAIQKRQSQGRQLIFNTTLQLVGWTNLKTQELKLPVETPQSEQLNYSFSGVQILNPTIFSFMSDQKDNKFSIIDIYLNAANQQPIYGYDHSDGLWLDAGTPQALKEAETHIKDL